MNRADAKPGLAVKGPQGEGKLIHATNGWDVMLTTGEVRQSIDFAEYEIIDEARKLAEPSRKSRFSQ